MSKRPATTREKAARSLPETATIAVMQSFLRQESDARDQNSLAAIRTLVAKIKTMTGLRNVIFACKLGAIDLSTRDGQRRQWLLDIVQSAITTLIEKEKQQTR